MNIALILSGGVGARTGQDVPKQYLTIYDVPIIVYTMLNIQESNVFDELYVVCSDGWADFIMSYAKQYNVYTLKGTISAGITRYDSMKNGINFLKQKNDDDIVAIFDGNRPATPHDVICNAVDKIKKNSCVIALAPCYDSMFYADKKAGVINGCADRSLLYMGQSPEVLYFKDAFDIVNSADDSLKGLTFTEAMYQQGKKVLFTNGSSKSLKITTSDDFAIIRSLLRDKHIFTLK